jgi:hypothetical protein
MKLPSSAVSAVGLGAEENIGRASFIHLVKKSGLQALISDAAVF